MYKGSREGLQLVFLIEAFGDAFKMLKGRGA